LILEGRRGSRGGGGGVACVGFDTRRSGGFLGISSAKDLVDSVSVGIGFGVSFPYIKKLITAQPPSNQQ
jgi:hypothetical protein